MGVDPKEDTYRGNGGKYLNFTLVLANECASDDR